MTSSNQAEFSIADRQFMAEAIQLAYKGRNTATPNPRVACVLVKDGAVVGRGWHQIAGQAHAEVNAIANAGSEARGSTAYITLEPCSFVGRTGACCDALQAAGIRRVVSAMEDPNPKVSGNGHAALSAAGIEVSCGLMAAEAAIINPGFIKRMQTALPFVRGKMAMSLDGRAAMASGESQWITGPAARKQVQNMRASSCAIVTGVGTVLQDNPKLTVREQDFGESVQRQPALIVLDSHLKTPVDAAIFDQAEGASPRKIYIAHVAGAAVERIDALGASGAELTELPSAENTDNNSVCLKALLRFLAEQELNEILLESGPKLAGSFIEQQLIDELKLFVAPKLMGGNAMPVFDLQFEKMCEARELDIRDITAVGNDWLITCGFKST